MQSTIDLISRKKVISALPTDNSDPPEGMLIASSNVSEQNLGRRMAVELE